jgi:hypothetical protein
MFLCPAEAVFVLNHPAAATPGGAVAAPAADQAGVRMRLEGADPGAPARGLDRLPGVSAYFLGDDPAGWRSEVPHYARVEYRQVYPGVDLVYYGNQDSIEYDFVVAPWAAPGQIRVAFQGIERMELDGSGDLLLATRVGVLRQHKPRVYQQVGARRVEVAAGYRLEGGTASFALASYNRDLPLVIDPVLTHSTYLGGADSEGAYAVAVDATGAAYLAGYTRSTNFPTANAYQDSKSADFDVFVTKLSPPDSTGAVFLEYSTYLGGGNPDRATSIAVDPDGAAYISGYTSSLRFPTVNAFQSTRAGGYDAFVAKLGPHGGSGPVSLVYSTYFGGEEADDEAYGIAVDKDGAAYIAGITYSSDFPVLNAYQSTLRGGVDAFVAKFGAYGGSGNVALVYSTYLGAAKSEGARAIAVDASGAAYVTGYTTSPGFPVLGAFQTGFQGGTDGFVARLNPNDGSGDVTLAYSTYLGGSGFDQPYGIALDPAGAVYVAGVTGSADYPVANAFQPVRAGAYDAFVTKLQPRAGAGAAQVVYSTFLGGSGNDYAYAIAVDAAGAAYVAGSTASPDFPLAGAFQASLAGGAYDLFLTKFDAYGSGKVGLNFSTYLGGTRSDEAAGVAVDPSGAAYIAGWSFSADFPTANAIQAAADTADAQDSDAVIARFAPAVPQPAFSAAGVVSAASFAGGAIAPGEIAAIYGANLGPAAGVANSGYDASTGKLPSALAGVSVSFDGQAAPLFYVSSGQINVQVPYEVAGKSSVTVVVTRDGATSAPVAVPVAAARPGVFAFNGRAIITDTLTGALITESNPPSGAGTAPSGRRARAWWRRRSRPALQLRRTPSAAPPTPKRGSTAPLWKSSSPA